MFYSRELLCRRGGKFGVIWSAATHKKVTRREYMAVHIRNSCEDIIDIIMVRASSSLPRQRQPRFSLYLSAQLMYGVSLVFRHQTDYLLSDAKTLWKRLRSDPSAEMDIDLKVTGRERQLVTLELDFNAFEEASLGDLSDLTEHHVSYTKMQESPRQRSLSGSFGPDGDTSGPHEVNDITMAHTVPNELISIKEVDTLSPVSKEVLPEDDLPPMTVQDIEWLKQINISPYSPTEHKLHDKESVPKKTSQGRPHKSQVPNSPDVTIPSIGRVRKRQRSQAQRKLPFEALELSPLGDGEAEDEGVTRKRRRRLAIDKVTEVSRVMMRRNFHTSGYLTEPMKLPSRQSTAHTLMSTSAHRLCNHKMFSRCLDAAYYGLKTYESDEGRPLWYGGVLTSSESISSGETSGNGAADLPAQDASSIEGGLLRTEPISVDEHHTLAERELHPESIESLHKNETVNSALRSKQFEESAEIQREGVSLVDDSRQQSMMSLQTSSRSVSALRPPSAMQSKRLLVSPDRDDQFDLAIRGTVVDGDNSGIPHSPHHSNYLDLLAKVARNAAESQWTTFQVICPRTTPKQKVASLFACLLDAKACGALILKQKHEFGTIYIKRGLYFQ